MKKRLSAILLAVLLLVGLIPTSVFAAPSDDPLLNAIYLRNNDEGSISKNIGDTGSISGCRGLPTPAEFVTEPFASLFRTITLDAAMN